MSSKNSRRTIYSEYIHQQLIIAAQKGGLSCNFEILAARLGLKPTHNLRRRLQQEEEKGVLTIRMVAERGLGSHYVYDIHPLPQEMLPTELSEFDPVAGDYDYDAIMAQFWDGIDDATDPSNSYP